MEQNNKKIILPKIIITFFSFLSIYEIIISSEYIFMRKNKNSFQNNILTFIIIRCILNILICKYIYNNEIQNININIKKYKLYDIILYSMIYIYNIFTINFYININDCGIFKIAIIIEFVIFCIISTIISLFVGL